MPQFWTEDPSIGQALSGLAESFSGKNVVSMANTIEDIKQKRLLAQARADAAAKAEAMWNARATPQAAPVTSAQDAWVNSSGTQGTENVPIMGGLKPLAPLAPAQAADTAATGQAQQQINDEFARVRAKNLADARLAYNVASSAGDVVGNMPKQEAYTQLDLYGVPKTLDAQTKMQTQLTGQLPMLDVKGTTSNYTVQDSQGNTIGAGTTRDGRTDLNTLQPIQAPPGGRVLKTGDLAADQNPYKDTGAQLDSLSKLTTKVAIGQQGLSEQEKQQANILLGTLYPGERKEVKDDAGNIRIIQFNPKVVPAVFNPLIAQLTGATGAPAGAPGAPAPAQQLQPATAAPAGPQQPQTDPLAAIVPPGVTTGPNPPGQGPIVPPGQPGPPIVVQGSGDTQLKEVLNNPIVKGAMDAGRAYNELLAASQAKTPESDLHMVYMLAKIYDPNSVVREGEVATATNTSPAMEKWWGLYNKQMEAGTQLSDRARASFIDEGYKAAQAHYAAAAPIVQMSSDRATRLGLDPRNTTPPLSAPQRPGGTQAVTGGRAPPQVGDVVMGRRFLGGDPAKRESWQ